MREAKMNRAGTDYAPYEEQSSQWLQTELIGKLEFYEDLMSRVAKLGEDDGRLRRTNARIARIAYILLDRDDLFSPR